MCGVDDYAEPIFSGWRKARKLHRCFACHEEIRAGDHYHVTAEKYDEFQVFKHCSRCWAILNAILRAGASSARYDLNCGESWESNFGPLPEDVASLAFLTPDEAQKLASRTRNDALGE